MPLGVYVGSSLSHTGFMTDTVSLQFSDLTGSTRFGVRTGLTLRLGALGRLSASDLLPPALRPHRLFHPPPLNADGREAAPTDYCRQALADMSDQLTVTSAVQFTDRLSADELADLMARHPELTFLSGKVGNEGVYTPQSLFCSLTPAGISFGDALESDYPGFTLPHTNITGAALRQHFEAMLQCLIDHPSVAKAASMMGNETHNYKRLLQDVQDNGLQFTGVWVQGTPSALLSLMDETCSKKHQQLRGPHPPGELRCIAKMCNKKRGVLPSLLAMRNTLASLCEGGTGCRKKPVIAGQSAGAGFYPSRRFTFALPCLSLWERWPSCSEDGEGKP